MENDYKNLKKEYMKICESKEYLKQYDIVLGCVKRAIAEWYQGKNNLSKHYGNHYKDIHGLDNFKCVWIGVSNGINYDIVNRIPFNSEAVAQNLWHECIDTGFDLYDTFEEDFSMNTCIIVAEKILLYLSEALPYSARFVLPEHIQSLFENICSSCGVEWVKDENSPFYRCEKCDDVVLKPQSENCPKCNEKYIRFSEVYRCSKCGAYVFRHNKQR